MRNLTTSDPQGDAVAKHCASNHQWQIDLVDDEDLILRRIPQIKSFPVHHPITIRTTDKRERRFIWNLSEDIGVFHGVKDADNIPWLRGTRAESEEPEMCNEERSVVPLRRLI